MNITPASISLMQLQALGSVMGPSDGKKNGDSFASMFSLLIAGGTPYDPLFLSKISTDPLSLIAPTGSIKGPSPTGRNMALFDPESAYRMMTVINNKEVCYKAQISELSQMEARIFQMRDAGRNLSNVTLSTGNDSIRSQLQSFVSEYNNWIQRFNPDVQQGGMLADTQAARASRFELEQNFNNPCFGVRGGVQGLRGLGIMIDPHTHLAALDGDRLDALLVANKQGVINVVQEFGANFAKSASLLNSEGNFILKQLDNLSRAIHFIDDNKASWQAEFGTGDAAKPTGQVAQVLTAYSQST